MIWLTQENNSDNGIAREIPIKPRAHRFPQIAEKDLYHGLEKKCRRANCEMLNTFNVPAPVSSHLSSAKR